MCSVYAAVGSPSSKGLRTNTRRYAPHTSWCPPRIRNALQSIKTHTKFIQDVRYAPSGDQFASVGSDSKIFVYDGKTGETLGEIADSPHTGSIVRTACLAGGEW